MKKMLSKKEELSLARAWLEHGRNDARSKLLDSYQPMIRNIARKYLRGGLTMDDLVQEGGIGFLSALDNFDPDQGYSVGTLARFHIRARIQLYVSEFAGLVRLPNSRRIKGLLTNCVAKIRFEENQRGETLDKEEKARICQEAGYSIDELEHYEMVMRPAKSITSQAATDEDESGFELADTEVDTETQVAERLSLDAAQSALALIFQDMPERTRTILTMRHLSEDFVSLDSIAAEIGISRERVRRIEMDALDTIRLKLSGFGIKSLSDLL